MEQHAIWPNIAQEVQLLVLQMSKNLPGPNVVLVQDPAISQKPVPVAAFIAQEIHLWPKEPSVEPQW